MKKIKSLEELENHEINSPVLVMSGLKETPEVTIYAGKKENGYCFLSFNQQRPKKNVICKSWAEEREIEFNEEGYPRVHYTEGTCYYPGERKHKQNWRIIRRAIKKRGLL